MLALCTVEHVVVDARACRKRFHLVKLTVCDRYSCMLCGCVGGSKLILLPSTLVHKLHTKHTAVVEYELLLIHVVDVTTVVLPTRVAPTVRQHARVATRNIGARLRNITRQASPRRKSKPHLACTN